MVIIMLYSTKLPYTILVYSPYCSKIRLLKYLYNIIIVSTAVEVMPI